jgi:acyl CoA:acetate/3-ketoacid CoA transferase
VYVAHRTVDHEGTVPSPQEIAVAVRDHGGIGIAEVEYRVSNEAEP